ncbi:MAG: hypothetical protein F6J87_24065 [Spirulina sp. SIO3F2]|nr:hypothetical protein [Spirulina sp. SIO3F2]
MSKPIFETIDELPTKNVTTRVLKALDFAAPGEWHNTVGFKNTIREVTGESDPELIQAIGDRAVWLFNDKNEGYQRALWLYQTVDKADSALGAAALANMVGEKIPLLGFLNKVTPKADQAQAIDLTLKLVVEVVAFCQINGIPGDSLGDFLKALREYGGESLMRMVALVCLDAVIPFGPDFIQAVGSQLNQLNPTDLENNPFFSQVQKFIPGGTATSRLDFIGQSFEGVQGWMGDLVTSRGLTQKQITDNLSRFVEITDDRLDYLAAFLDMTTDYYAHTGTQTLARRLIERAAAEV